MPSDTSQCVRVSDNISISIDVSENELKELQEIGLGLLKLPEEYSQKESFKVFRKGSREVGKSLEGGFIMNNSEKLPKAIKHLWIFHLSYFVKHNPLESLLYSQSTSHICI